MLIYNNKRVEFGDGFRFAWGATVWFALLLTGVVLVDDYVWPSPFDSSDTPPTRSGLRIKTDHLTGCQYLAAPFSSVTPRMDASGKQICNQGG